MWHAGGASPYQLTLPVEPAAVVGAVRIWNRNDGGIYHRNIEGATIQLRGTDGVWRQCGNVLATTGESPPTPRSALTGVPGLLARSVAPLLSVDQIYADPEGGGG